MTGVFAPGRHVIVTLPEVGALPGRVDVASDAELVISLFVRPERPIAWLRGEVSVEAATPRGVYEVSGTLRARGQGVEALVGVELSGESRVVQRRSFVRVDAVVPAVVARDEDGAEEHHTVVVNLSGGGFRIASAPWLGVGEDVRFRIQLGDEREARGLARVVRLGEGDARACEISEIADADREALVRYTFDRQRAELRRRA